MQAICAAAAIAIVAGLAVAPAVAGERLRAEAVGAVVIGSEAGDATGYTPARHIARELNLRHRRLHNDRYEDGAGDSHRDAGR